jgi:phosphatidylglycerol:prolipoprotein diacylglycerol transferase
MDYTEVYFKGLSHVFHVQSILAQFTIAGHEFTIHWYGAIIAFGFILAALLGGRIAYTWKMSLDKMMDVLIYGTVFGVICARLYYCAFEWESYADDPLEIFRIWHGGLAIYGGIIGGIAAAFITSKVRKLNFLNLLDCVGISLLVGQGVGRWGNFANQEAFGTNTDLPWGMWSEKTMRYILLHQEEFAAHGIAVQAGSLENKAYVHPTFLYESLWCMLGVLVLYILCRKLRRFSGQMFLAYGVWYGAERAFVEGLRTDSLYIGAFRVSQMLSIILSAICLVLLIIFWVRAVRHPKPIDGLDYYSDPTAGMKKAKKA